MHELGAVEKTLFFAWDEGTTGMELWKSDGTVAGTVLVKDIVPGPGRSDPGGFHAVGDTLYFTAYATGGQELWKSDGTAAGTMLVKDIWPGGLSSSPGSFERFGELLLFGARESTQVLTRQPLGFRHVRESRCDRLAHVVDALLGRDRGRVAA